MKRNNIFSEVITFWVAIYQTPFMFWYYYNKNLNKDKKNPYR
jgi:hypothetical protein